MAHPDRLARRDPATVEALFRALVYSGLSMTLAGTSFPASGGEHLVSHVLDMKALQENLPHDYHGRQVGLGTVFACALYERLAGMDAPEFRLVTEETDAAYWRSLAPVVEEEHAGKRRRAAAAVERLTEPGTWDRLRAVIADHAVPASVIKQCLRAAGGAHRLEDIGCSRDRFVNAALHCHQIRERYTVVDLARAAGLGEPDVRDIVDEYLSG
jgi:glycerol-1-phosphate dehydrogenase [NAD(P)+]